MKIPGDISFICIVCRKVAKNPFSSFDLSDPIKIRIKENELFNISVNNKRLNKLQDRPSVIAGQVNGDTCNGIIEKEVCISNSYYAVDNG